MIQRATRVLLIEDQETDYLLTRRMLSLIEGQSFELEWAASYQAGLEAIRLGVHDVCLLDYRIGESDGLELLKEARNAGCNAPVILLTGMGDYRVDLEAMRLGAADFLVKDQLTPALLERSIRYAIEQARTLEELRRQQEDLRVSELRYRSVVQTAGDAIILADDNSKIIGWNNGAERIFGYREEEILGFPLELLMPPHYRETHRLGFERFCVTGKAKLVGKTVELEGLRKDGTDFPLELSLASWTTSEGTFFTAIARDITERRRTEEMRRAKEAAEEATRAKSEFVASMSHELRTPLHAIIGFTNILLQNRARNLDVEEIDFLERILINARDQLGLINSVLDLSKVEAGKMEMQTAPVAVDAIIREVVKQLEGDRPNAGVKIVLRPPESTPPIQTDGPKLKQVLINLVENALKFTERGTVTVELITNPPDGLPLQIDVTDTGTGIPAHHLKEIFEPFRQLETKNNLGFGGTGLGLSISRSICDLLGYSLRVHSRAGHGSTFSILLNRETSRLPIPA